MGARQEIGLMVVALLLICISLLAMVEKPVQRDGIEQYDCQDPVEVSDFSGIRGIACRGNALEGEWRISPRLKGSHAILAGIKIPIDSARKEDIQAVSGIGPVLAGRIVEFTRRKKPLQSIEELLSVKGIGPKRLKKLTPFVRLGSW